MGLNCFIGDRQEFSAVIIPMPTLCHHAVGLGVQNIQVRWRQTRQVNSSGRPLLIIPGWNSFKKTWTEWLCIVLCMPFPDRQTFNLVILILGVRQTETGTGKARKDWISCYCCLEVGLFPLPDQFGGRFPTHPHILPPPCS